MNKQWRKFLSLICAITLVVGSIGLAAFAEDVVVPEVEVTAEEAAAEEAARIAAEEAAAEAARIAAEEEAARIAAEEEAARIAAEEEAARIAAEEEAARIVAEEEAARIAAEEEAARIAAEEEAARIAAEEEAARIVAEEEAARIAVEEEAVAEDAVEETIPEFVIEDAILVKYNGENAVVTVPDGVKEIGKKAFAGNTKVEKVILPDSVDVIAESAFEDCSNLKQVVLGSESKLAKIEKNAFKGDLKLDIAFAENVKAVSGDAFEDSLLPKEKEDVSEAEEAVEIEIVAEETVTEEEPVSEDPAIEEAPQEAAAEQVDGVEISTDVKAEDENQENIVADAETAPVVLNNDEGTQGEETELLVTDARALEPAVITKEPESVTVADGGAVEFKVEATGVASYQWQFRKATVWKNSSSTGYNTATLTTSANDTRYGYDYRCVLIGEDGKEVYTKEVRIIKPDAAPLTIKKQPTDVGAGPGQEVAFHVETEGAVNYMWQYKKPDAQWANAYSSAVGRTTDTLVTSLNEARCNYLFRCLIKGYDGTTTYTDEVKMYKADPEILTQPVSVTVAEGDKVEFKVEATGVVTYQWQFRKATVWKDSGSTGYNTDTLVTEANDTRYGYDYRCVLIGWDGKELITDSVRIIKPDATPLKIKEQPTDVGAGPGQEVVFHVETEGAVNYMWQYKKPEAEWANAYSTAVGRTTDTLLTSLNEARCNYLFRCLIKGYDGTSVYTDEVKMYVPELKIVTEPENVTAVPDGAVEFKVEATGVASYQWQFRKATVWKDSGSTGYNTDTLVTSASAVRYGYDYRCVLTGWDGTEITTATVRIVNPDATPLKITKQPADIDVAIGQDVSFHVEAEGAISYMWQYKKPDTDWANAYSSAEGRTTDTLLTSANAARCTYLFRCMLKGADGSTIYTDEVRMVRDTLKITAQPENVLAALDEEVSFKVEAKGVLSYQWQFKKGSGDWKNSSSAGSDTDTLTVEATDARFGYLYRCMVSDSEGSLYSEEVRMIKKLSIVEPDDIVIWTEAKGREVPWVVNAFGAVSYQWQFKANETAEWTDVADSDSETLNVKVTDDTLGMYQCIVKGEDTPEGEKQEETSKTFTLELMEGFDSNNILYVILYDENAENGLATGEWNVSIAGYAEGKGEASLTIPENPEDGFTVTEVGEKAFYGNDVLESIDLPDTITIIRKQAFMNCTSLKEMK